MESQRLQVPFSTVSHSPQHYYQAVKRIVDLTLSLIALVLLAPVMAVIALLVKLDSAGPAFFVQKRIGRGGRPFDIIKFRTMQHKLDDSAHRAFMSAFVSGEIEYEGRGKAVYKPFEESQVTRMGRFLRKTSLDELPQLFNVLVGDMSLVGPRPNVPWEVDAYKSWHRERLAVLPGITGLAQVNGRSGIKFDTIVEYDIEYIRRQSLTMDAGILLKTVLSVLSGKGAH